jgi:hypothetical protein
VPYLEAFFPSIKLFEESSIFGSATASCATGAAVGVCAMDDGVGGASWLSFDFGVRDFSRGPWPLALTLKFLHLSYSSRKQ